MDFNFKLSADGNSISAKCKITPDRKNHRAIVDCEATQCESGNCEFGRVKFDLPEDQPQIKDMMEALTKK